MEQLVKRIKYVDHLAGIVPVAAPPLEFKMPWHDSMMPIAPDYLAVERAVYECVLAGCRTIWIVCHMSMQPLLRKRIGDTVLQPSTKLEKKPNYDEATRINVFYVPIHPKDRDRRDCLAWSVLYGANSAYRLCKFISKWIIPEKFYCAFPYGITDDKFISENKNNFCSVTEKQFLSFNGKTVRDGYYLSFTFDADDFKKCRNFIRTYALTQWNPDERAQPFPKLAQTLTIEQVFKNIDLEGRSVIECPWFYNIATWEDYSKFIGSGMRLIKNKKSINGKNYREKTKDAFNTGGRESVSEDSESEERE